MVFFFHGTVFLLSLSLNNEFMNMQITKGQLLGGAKHFILISNGPLMQL